MSLANRSAADSRKIPIITISGLGVAALIVALVIVGWNYSTASSTALSPAARQQAQARGSIPAPDFTIETIDGQTVSLAQEKGRVLGIMFVASWCTSCVPEAHAWGQLYAKYHDEGLDVLIVDVDAVGTREELFALQEFKSWVGGGDHWWAFDPQQTLVKAFRVQALDTTYIIGRDGSGGLFRRLLDTGRFAFTRSSERAAMNAIHNRRVWGFGPTAAQIKASRTHFAAV